MPTKPNFESLTGPSTWAIRLFSYPTTRASFEANSARRLGGALFAQNSSTATFLGSVTFRANAAQQRGAVSMQDSVLGMSDGTTFTANTAPELGGAILANRANLTLFSLQHGGIVFANNSADTGGAASIQSSADPPIMRNVIFKNNSASSGGAVAIFFTGSGDDPGVLAACVPEGNMADSDGGALEFISGYLSIESCVFHDNIAGGVS